MLDITYLFPEEPIEEDSLIILNHLPHSMLNRELRRVLAEAGFTWHGSQTNTNGENGSVVGFGPRKGVVQATMLLGCIEKNESYMGSLITDIDEKLKNFRFNDTRTQLKAYSITHSAHRPGNAWFKLHFVRI